MKNLEMRVLGVQELDSREMRELDGGVIDPVSIAIGVATLGLAAFAFGYQIGKDLAESDRRNH